MNTRTSARTAAALTLALAAGSALAHPGHADGALHGWLHPLGGADHLLAMLAVGLWAALATGAARQALAPLAFVGAMLAGALAAQAGWAVPAALEGLIALSVLALGALLVWRRRLAFAAGLAIVAVAGVLHGAAHGLEAGAGPGFGAFAVGFTGSTLALHLAGLALGRRLVHLRPAAWTAIGAAIGLSGLALALARF